MGIDETNELLCNSWLNIVGDITIDFYKKPPNSRKLLDVLKEEYDVFFVYHPTY